MLEFFLDLTLYLLFKAILGAFFDIIFSGNRVKNVRFDCINHRADYGINLFVDILLRAADHRTDNVLNLGGHFLVYLFAENLLRPSDDKLCGNGDIAVFIYGNVGNVLRFISFVLQRVFIGGRQLFNNIFDDIRRAKDVADILEEEVAHEAAANDLLTFQSARDRQYLCRVELNHFALFIFTENREEVQQAFNISLSIFGGTAAVNRCFGKIVGELIVDDQRSRGVKVEDIRIFFHISFAVRRCQLAGVLRSERRLHIRRWAFHVAQHQNAAPFGHGNADCELSYGQSDRFIVLCDRRPDTLQRLGVDLIFIGGSAVACGNDDLIFTEKLAELLGVHHLFQSFRGRNTVQVPHCVAQFTSEFRCGKRVFFVGEQRPQELFDLVLKHKFSAFVRGKKLIEIKGIVHGFFIR